MALLPVSMEQAKKHIKWNKNKLYNPREKSVVIRREGGKSSASQVKGSIVFIL